MKNLFYLLLVILFTSCTAQRCPTTDKRYFFKEVPKSKSLYSGYSRKRYNSSWTYGKYKPLKIKY
jgi:hypothetical protein